MDMLWEEGGRRRAKDLELLSENIDGMEPVAVSLQPKTHVNVAQVELHLGNAVLFFSKAIFIYLEGKLIEIEVCGALSVLLSLLWEHFYWQDGDAEILKLPIAPIKYLL